MKTSGERFEELAAGLLTRHNLHILARNWSCRAGEIDIVARDGEHLVFVEVRARKRSRFGGAAATVDHRKQGRITRAARWFLKNNSAWGDMPCRFDVIAFELPGKGIQEPPTARWIKGAFTA